MWVSTRMDGAPTLIVHDVHEDNFLSLHISLSAMNKDWNLVRCKNGLEIIFYGEDDYRWSIFELWTCDIVHCDPQSWNLIFSSDFSKGIVLLLWFSNNKFFAVEESDDEGEDDENLHNEDDDDIDKNIQSFHLFYTW